MPHELTITETPHRTERQLFGGGAMVRIYDAHDAPEAIAAILRGLDAYFYHHPEAFADRSTLAPHLFPETTDDN